MLKPTISDTTREPSPAPDLSIAIISTDNHEQMMGCLGSVFSSTSSSILEIHVLVNGGPFESAKLLQDDYPHIEVLWNKRRLGFSTNNNKVLSTARGRYLMLLNDDTIVTEGAFDHMVRFMDDNPEVGAVGAQLLDPDGSPQPSWDYPPDPLYEALRPLSSWLRPAFVAGEDPLEVGSVNGACMLVRRKAIEDVGPLDVEFDPIYSEEVDWCHRIRLAGWKIYSLPESKVIHFGSQTMNRDPLRKIDLLYAHKALLIRKHFGKGSVRKFKLALFAISLAKLIGWAVVSPFKPAIAPFKIATHRRVATRALFL